MSFHTRYFYSQWARTVFLDTMHVCIWFIRHNNDIKRFYCWHKMLLQIEHTTITKYNKWMDVSSSIWIFRLCVVICFKINNLRSHLRCGQQHRWNMWPPYLLTIYVRASYFEWFELQCIHACLIHGSYIANYFYRTRHISRLCLMCFMDWSFLQYAMFKKLDRIARGISKYFWVYLYISKTTYHSLQKN